MCRREPRRGRRLTLAATIATPAGPLLVYSAHLEVFCGPVGRLRQFADILTHSRAAAARGAARQVIGGDLNTMAHGIARLSPWHCTDHLRWATLGQCEAAFWQHHVFDVAGDITLPSAQARPSAPAPLTAVPRVFRVTSAAAPHWRMFMAVRPGGGWADGVRINFGRFDDFSRLSPHSYNQKMPVASSDGAQ